MRAHTASMPRSNPDQRDCMLEMICGGSRISGFEIFVAEAETQQRAIAAGCKHALNLAMESEFIRWDDSSCRMRLNSGVASFMIAQFPSSNQPEVP